MLAGSNPAVDGCFTAFKTTELDFGPQLQSAAFTFVPPLLQIISERINQDRGRVWPSVRRLTARSEPALDRPHAHADARPHAPRRQAVRAQAQDFGKSNRRWSPRAAKLIQFCRRSFEPGLIFGHIGNRGLSSGSDRFPMTANSQMHRFTHIL